MSIVCTMDLAEVLNMFRAAVMGLSQTCAHLPKCLSQCCMSGPSACPKKSTRNCHLSSTGSLVQSWSVVPRSMDGRVVTQAKLGQTTSFLRCTNEHQRAHCAFYRRLSSCTTSKLPTWYERFPIARRSVLNGTHRTCITTTW